ncbi:MAG TPA: hypothetical protein VG168_04875 [Bryobacteraceae bacterium]|nr:hypothetical protein [Bryobacteraceae bacterium]
MKYTIRILMLTMTLLPMMAAAQIQRDGKLQAKVPFDFTIGSKIVPTGELTVRRASLINGTLALCNREAKVNMIANFNRVEAKTPAATTALVFRKYGHRYFLWQVKVEGTRSMYESPRSRAEAELQAQNVHPEEILLALK